MRSIRFIPLFVPLLAAAQLSVKSYYDTFTNAGPQVERTTALANGDVLYYDQGWNGLARLGPNGDPVWYVRLDLSTDPAEFTTIAHAVEKDNGELVLAVIKRNADATYNPGLVRLNPSGGLLSASLCTDVQVQVLDWIRLVALSSVQGEQLRMSIRGTGSGGSLHGFSDQGAHLFSLSFSGNSELPVEWLRQGSTLVGANVGRLQTYDTGGTPGWALVPGSTSVGGTQYTAFIWDVTPVPIGYAFAFLRTGGPELMMPGIGLVSSTGVFQGAVVFEIDELQGMTNLFDRPRIVSTFTGLAMVANNGSSTDPQGYLFTCAHDLSNMQVLKVDLGDEAYPRSLSSTPGSSVIMTGYLDQQGVGERMVARTTFGADMSSCFPTVPFTPQPFPMATLPPLPFSGQAMTSTWTSVMPTLTAGNFAWDLICGVQAVEDPAKVHDAVLSPNPASDHVRISWPIQEAFEVSLYDAQGRMVQGPTRTLPGVETPVGGLAPGTYLLRIVTPWSATSRPLVVERNGP